jgi:flagellar biosynthetic protein FliS
MSNQYLESKVTTASQPELQLMLLDGALRHGRVASQTMLQEQELQRHEEAMHKTLDILESLVYGAAQGTSELSRSVEEQFAFLFREVANAQINRDLAKLNQAIELLAYHRETWRLACQQLKADPALPASTTPLAPTLAPISTSQPGDPIDHTASFSLEA